MTDLQARVAELEAENAALKAQLARFQAATGTEFVWPAAWDLSPAQSALFSAIARRRGAVCSTADAKSAMYGPDPARHPGSRVVPVVMCRLRHRLGRFGIKILTVDGQGYALAPEALRKVAAVQRVQP